MNSKRIKRFDFEKKPHRPSFLMSLAKLIISFPDLRKRGTVITKHNMEGIEGKPYLLLINHGSMVDFNIMLKATHPDPINNVMTLEGFKTYTEPLMRSLGVLGKRKFITDLNLIKNIKYCLTTLGTTFVLYPEARYSLDGCTSYLPPSLGKLAKMYKVPLVMLKISGNFVTCPQWNKINKKSYVEAEMYPIATAEELKSLSIDEINTRIAESFAYDDFAWQYEKKLVIDHPKRAEGLHCLLYKCPHCGAEFQTDSSGAELWCNACGKRWTMDEYGRMHAQNGETEYEHIPDWSKWERQCVRDEVRNGTYYFEDTVDIETLPNAWRFYKQGKGKFIQNYEGTRVECNYYGKPYVLDKPAITLESMHIEYDYLGGGDCVDVSIPDDSFWCYFSKRDVVTKISFATEEMHSLARERLETQKQTASDKKDDK